jgi:hypothetical protein
MVEHFKNLKLLIFIVLSIALITAIVSYFSSNQKDLVTANAKKISKYEVQGITVSNDVLIYDSIDNMAQGADVVVVGNFHRMANTINMLRDPENILKESPYGYEEGRIYDFKIDEVIAGEVNKKKIQVGLRYSNELEFIDKKGSKQFVQVTNSLYKKPDSEQKYILFLYKNQELDTYFVPFEPYRLVINEDNTVSVDSVLIEDSHDAEEVQVVRLQATKEELHVKDEVHGEIDDKISGKQFEDIKKSIKDSFKKKN